MPSIWILFKQFQATTNTHAETPTSLLTNDFLVGALSPSTSSLFPTCVAILDHEFVKAILQDHSLLVEFVFSIVVVFFVFSSLITQFIQTHLVLCDDRTKLKGRLRVAAPASMLHILKFLLVDNESLIEIANFLLLCITDPLETELPHVLGVPSGL